MTVFGLSSYLASLSMYHISPQFLTVISGILSASAGIVWFLRQGKSGSAARLEDFKAKVSNVPAHQIATIFLAVTEDNLVSNRKYGAAADRKTAHVSVVRELKSLGALTAEQSNSEIETVLQIQPNWKKENLKLVVFVQENASRKILGVNRKSLK